MKTTEPRVVEGHLERLELIVGDGPSTSVRVTLRRGASGQQWEVLFSGVASLLVSQEISNWPVTLQIVDIQDRGMEGLRFSVTDPEAGTLSCLCADVTEVPGP